MNRNQQKDQQKYQGKFYLIYVQTQDDSIFEFWEQNGIEFVQGSPTPKNKMLNFVAKVTDDLINQIEKNLKIKITKKQDFEEVAKAKQRLVGTGNRYL